MAGVLYLQAFHDGIVCLDADDIAPLSTVHDGVSRPSDQDRLVDEQVFFIDLIPIDKNHVMRLCRAQSLTYGNECLAFSDLDCPCRQ